MMGLQSGRALRPLVFLLAVGLVLLVLLLAPPRISDVVIPDTAEAVARGEYLVFAGGCISCHQNPDNPDELSGGLGLASDFGTFYVPNITPDPETGVGNWSGRDFIAALKHGRSPSGSFYFPAFPYLSYAGMSDEDVLAVAAYLRSLPPVSRAVPEHDKPAWLARWMMSGWNRLAATGRPETGTTSDPVISRGAYLARNLGHCGECHTPRNALGMPDWDREFAGAVIGESEAEPIDAEAMAEWTEEDFAFLLLLGVKPDDEYVGGEMEPVIEHNTSKLSEADRAALAAFFVRGQAGRN